MEDPEQEVTLKFTVTIKTYGDPKKVKRVAGKTLAKQCALAFVDSEVTSGAVHYSWHQTDHAVWWHRREST